jgi:hypothetical protein
MMHALYRFSSAVLIAGFMLAGCAEKPATRTTTHTAAPVAGTSPAPAEGTPHAARTSSEANENRTASRLPEKTGIPACDEYLSSYIACHRAANIFAPGQLPARYKAMRTSLLRDSQNPDIRPQLAARCNSLATQLREALHGKSCAVEPASGSSSP